MKIRSNIHPLPGLCIFVFLVLSFPLGASTTVDAQVDWTSGKLNIMARRPLEEGMNPQDHPRSLALLEQELFEQLFTIIQNLPLMRETTVGGQFSQDTNLVDRIEGVRDLLYREWSRLSLDQSAVEAKYSLNLFALLPRVIPIGQAQPLPPAPLGWVPTPEDDWTGLVIYVPPELPLQGTKRKVIPSPALLPRILAPDFSLLAAPRTVNIKDFQKWGIAAYAPLARREEFEDRVGRRPYRVMARKAYDETAYELILPQEAAQRLLASPSGRRILQEGRILILMDENPSP